MIRFFIKFIVLISLLGACLWYGLSTFQKNNVVYDGEVLIAKGLSAKQIANTLETYDIVDNADVFYYYIRLKELYFNKVKQEPDQFKIAFNHGNFNIKSGDFDYLVRQLNEKTLGNKDFIAVTFPEGTTLLQIADKLEKNGFYDSNSFIDYLQKEETYLTYKETYSWLPEYKQGRLFAFEGFLHTNTYHIPKDFTMDETIEMLLEPTQSFYDKNKDLIDTSPLSFHELITLASVVERESKFSEDRPKVAQVFHNRLNKGMKLESDITAAYASGEHKVFMYYKDIEIDSPYNTYKIKGLPIGPISSPSLESLEAVLHPSGSDFDALYFYARPNGETFYAKTWQEHDKNRQKWEHEWKELEKKQ